jgi:hypothetical protein
VRQLGEPELIAGRGEHPLSASTDYKGQKVGFCCAGCVGQWNKLTDEQRDERLARVRK